MNQSALELRNATVRFGATTALGGVDLAVKPGELLVLLGPSGCGKTTLLRTVVGLQPLDAGQVLLGGEDVEHHRPDQRAVGLMFQDDVLFPHLDVAGNVEFGMRMRNWSKPERHQRALEMLKLVGLAGFGSRNTATLSGGERQRVGLARALAPKPSVMLLDEPFGALDRPLRERLVDELGPLLASQGVSAVHVTHDHDEAYALGDRVAVMIAGEIQAVGTPTDVWHQPRTVAVANFLGHRNTFTAQEWTQLTGTTTASPPAAAATEGTVDDTKAAPTAFAVRADRIHVIEAGGDATTTDQPSEAPSSGHSLTGTVTRRRFAGTRWELLVQVAPDAELQVLGPASPPTGTTVRLHVDPTALIPLTG